MGRARRGLRVPPPLRGAGLAGDRRALLAGVVVCPPHLTLAPRGCNRLPGAAHRVTRGLGTLGVSPSLERPAVRPRTARQAGGSRRPLLLRPRLTVEPPSPRPLDRRAPRAAASPQNGTAVTAAVVVPRPWKRRVTVTTGRTDSTRRRELLTPGHLRLGRWPSRAHASAVYLGLVCIVTASSACPGVGGEDSAPAGPCEHRPRSWSLCRCVSFAPSESPRRGCRAGLCSFRFACVQSCGRAE